MWCQPLGNVALQFLLDRRGGKLDVGPNVGVSGFESVPRAKSITGIWEYTRNAKFESVNRVTVFPVQRPSDGLIQLFKRSLGFFRNATALLVECSGHPNALISHILPHDGVYDFALVVSLVALDDIFGGDTSL